MKEALAASLARRRALLESDPKAESYADALRLFWGEREAPRGSPLEAIVIEKFGPLLWISSTRAGAAPEELREPQLFKEWDVKGAVFQSRPAAGGPEVPTALWGEAWLTSQAATGCEAREWGLRYRIRWDGVKHPGLFLDQWRLREWLLENAKGLRVLNLFSYTASLSLAAAAGAASEVMSLDLSRPTTEWARENFALNSDAFSPELKTDFVYGDVFEWLPKLAKRSARYDLVICDPPSFSRGKKGVFSVEKDTARLHALIFPLLDSRGWLATTINHAQSTREQFAQWVGEGAAQAGRAAKLACAFELPPSFLVRQDYLKSLLFRVG